MLVIKKALSYSKTGNKKYATYLRATLLQNKLNGDVARFTTHVQTNLATNKAARFFFVRGKTHNIAIQLVLQKCYKTSCTFFVARFTVTLLFLALVRGFIKVLKRRATEFDTPTKNWRGPKGLAP